MNKFVTIKDAVMLFSAIMIIYTILLSSKVFKMGYRKGYKKKIEDAQQLKYKFHKELCTLQHYLAGRNPEGRHDEYIIKILNMKKTIHRLNIPKE